MSFAAAAATKEGIPRWFRRVFFRVTEDIDEWPKYVIRVFVRLQRYLFEAYWRPGQRAVVTIPVWKIALDCGRCQRTIWLAFAWLAEHGIIRRFWINGRTEVENRKGHHGEVGRATEITIEWARPEPKPKREGKPKAAPAADPAAAAAAAAAIAQAEAESVSDPVSVFDRKTFVDTIRGIIGKDMPAPPKPAPSLSPREIEAEMERKRAESAARFPHLTGSDHEDSTDPPQRE